jgi:hypothetical protein
MNKNHRDFVELLDQVRDNVSDLYQQLARDLTLLRIEGTRFGLARSPDPKLPDRQKLFLERLPDWTRDIWFRLQATSMLEWVVAYLPLARKVSGGFKPEIPSWLSLEDLFSELLLKLVELYRSEKIQLRQPVTDDPDDVEADTQMFWLVRESLKNHAIGFCEERGDVERACRSLDEGWTPETELKLFLPKLPTGPKDAAWEQIRDQRALLRRQHYQKKGRASFDYVDQDQFEAAGQCDESLTQAAATPLDIALYRERVAECRKALLEACTDRLDKWIVVMRARGYSHQDIATRLRLRFGLKSLSRAMVSRVLDRILKTLSERFELQNDRGETGYRSHKRSRKSRVTPDRFERRDEFYILQHGARGKPQIVKPDQLPADQTKCFWRGPYETKAIARSLMNQKLVAKCKNSQRIEETPLRFLSQVPVRRATDRSKAKFPNDFRPPLLDYLHGRSRFQDMAERLQGDKAFEKRLEESRKDAVRMRFMEIASQPVNNSKQVATRVQPSNRNQRKSSKLRQANLAT